MTNKGGKMRTVVFMFAGAFYLLGTAQAFAAKTESYETALRAQFEIKKEKIQQLFNDKVQKIGERPAIPEDLRQMLIQQADEIKKFDLETLDKKLNMKLYHAQQRNTIKDRLKEDAVSNIQWIMDNEREFEKKKADRRNEASVFSLQPSAPRNALSKEDTAEIERLEKDAMTELFALGGNEPEVQIEMEKLSSRVKQMMQEGASKQDIVKLLDEEKMRVIEIARSKQAK